MNEKLGVVMPVFNAANYLEEAIRSVLEQSYEDFEFVIVDDGSTDQSEQIIRRYADQDARVRLVSQANQGVAKAMNAGAAALGGEWIVVMHADDVMERDRLKTINDATDQVAPGIGIISSKVSLISERGEIIGRASPSLPANPFFLEKCDNEGYIVGGIYHTATSIRRSAFDEVGGFDVTCRVNEDVELYNRMVEKGWGILVLDHYLMRYRIHSNAASAAKSRELARHWRYVKACIRARRGGSALPTWEEFSREQERRPGVRKLNEWRKDTAKHLYRKSASALSAKRLIPCCLAGLGCFALQPWFFVYKITTRRYVRF